MSNIKQNLFFAFIYNASACRLRPAFSIQSWVCYKSDDCRRCNEFKFRIGDR